MSYPPRLHPCLTFRPRLPVERKNLWLLNSGSISNLPLLPLFLCSSLISRMQVDLSPRRYDVAQKESEFRQRVIRGDRREGCDQEQDAQEFLWIFFIEPAAPESRVKRGKTRDMARSRSEEGEVLFLSFFELLMELANFSAPPVFGLPLIQALLLRNHDR